MLKELLIKNFAIIEDLNIEFDKGFIALTGETGSGKSIIIDALSLLLGQRSSFDKIRNGKTKAVVEGVFKVESNEHLDIIKEILDDDLEDDTLIISRTLDLNGKTVVKINSRTIPLSVLKSITSNLINIHSQQKDHNYLDDNNQIKLLDKYMLNNAEENEINIYNEYINEYRVLKNIEEDIEHLNSIKDDVGSVDYLSYQIEELNKIDIQPNEMENLEEEKLNLQNFAKTSEKIQEFIYEYDALSSHLYNAKKALSYSNDEEFSLLSNKFDDLYYSIEDVNLEIREKFEEYTNSLERLNFINERLFLLHGLRKKYGYSTEEILKKHQELKNNLDDIIQFDDKLSVLKTKYDIQKDKCLSLGNKLNGIRKKYALSLSNDVNNELKSLYLENADFKIDISVNDELSCDGIDSILFMLKANKGENYLPLNKTASLGETSRLNLALKCVFNTLDSIETIIFDEIDIGVSGRVASSIARKMKTISKTSQVIVISHLPQVSASADYHYVVKKEVIDDKTYSSIKVLNDEERVIEIAKMISNENINEASLSASRELLKNN